MGAVDNLKRASLEIELEMVCSELAQNFEGSEKNMGPRMAGTIALRLVRIIKSCARVSGISAGNALQSD